MRVREWVGVLYEINMCLHDRFRSWIKPLVEKKKKRSVRHLKHMLTQFYVSAIEFSRFLLSEYFHRRCPEIHYHFCMRCAIWYHLYNLKNVKNTHVGVLILVKLQASLFHNKFYNMFSEVAALHMLSKILKNICGGYLWPARCRPATLLKINSSILGIFQ